MFSCQLCYSTLHRILGLIANILSESFTVDHGQPSRHDHVSIKSGPINQYTPSNSRLVHHARHADDLPGYLPPLAPVLVLEVLRHQRPHLVERVRRPRLRAPPRRHEPRQHEAEAAHKLVGALERGTGPAALRRARRGTPAPAGGPRPTPRRTTARCRASAWASRPAAAPQTAAPQNADRMSGNQKRCALLAGNVVAPKTPPGLRTRWTSGTAPRVSKRNDRSRGLESYRREPHRALGLYAAPALWQHG